MAASAQTRKRTKAYYGVGPAKRKVMYIHVPVLGTGLLVIGRH